MECNGINLRPLFGLIKKEWNGAEPNGMHFIPFLHFPSLFVPSDLGRMTKLLYSVMKYPNSGMTSLFHSAPPISALFVLQYPLQCPNIVRVNHMVLI